VLTRHAVDVIAGADDETLFHMTFADREEIFDALKTLRFLASLVLTMRQAKRLEDVWGGGP
jgi:hypothetical protein